MFSGFSLEAMYQSSQLLRAAQALAASRILHNPMGATIGSDLPPVFVENVVPEKGQQQSGQPYRAPGAILKNSLVQEGEAFYEFREKFLKCLQKIVKIAKTEGKTILIVSHYRNAKLSDAWVKAGEPADRSIDEKTMLQDNVNPAETIKIPVK